MTFTKEMSGKIKQGTTDRTTYDNRASAWANATRTTPLSPRQLRESNKPACADFKESQRSWLD